MRSTEDDGVACPHADSLRCSASSSPSARALKVESPPASSNTADKSDPKRAVPPKWGHLQTETEEEAIIKAEEESRLSALGEAEALEVLKEVMRKFDQPLSQHRVAELGSVDYDLRAVVHHRGRRATSGHYVTDVRTIQDQHPDRWSRFDDAYHHDRFSEVQATGTESEGSAYIFYYVRRSPSAAVPPIAGAAARA
jgi:hypothetical protein